MTKRVFNSREEWTAYKDSLKKAKDSKVFDLVEGGEKIDLFGTDETDYTKMSKEQTIAYLKSTYKLDEVMNVIASNPILSKKFLFGGKAYLEDRKELLEYKQTAFAAEYKKKNLELQDMSLLHMFGFGKAEGDSIVYQDALPSKQLRGHTKVPTKVGYFDPETWGTGK